MSSLLLMGAVFLLGLPGAPADARTPGSARTQKVCKTVKKRSHGRSFKVRRCRLVKVNAKPKVPTPTPPASEGYAPDEITLPVVHPATVEGLLAAAVVACTNVERVKAGLSVLIEDPALTRAAQAHADDMKARSYFAHETPEGGTPWERIEAALHGESPFMEMGENLAMGFQDAAGACVGWMNSPGHRANILNPDYIFIGAAWSGTYAAQEFGGR